MEQRKFLLVVVLSVILCNVVAFFLIKASFKKELTVSREIRRADFGEYQKELRHIGSSLFYVALGRTVDNIVKPKDSPQAKTLKISEYVSSKICNGEDTNLFYGEDQIAMSAFANRAGFCASKAQLMKKMLYLVGIPARLFNIYNFGKPGNGHTVLQVWFENQWHFIDPTLGGYFQDPSGHILSWQELEAHPEKTKQYLKVFSSSCSSEEPDPIKNQAINQTLVSAYYTSELVTSPYNAPGFHKLDLFHLPARVSAKQFPLSLGKKDQLFEDVNQAGVDLGITERLADALNTFHDRFVTDWEFRDMEPNAQYELEYSVYKAKNMNGAYLAKPVNAKIHSGDIFQSTDFPDKTVWKIVFEPTQSENVHIEIRYNRETMDEGLFVDQIALHKVEAIH